MRQQTTTFSTVDSLPAVSASTLTRYAADAGIFLSTDSVSLYTAISSYVIVTVHTGRVWRLLRYKDSFQRSSSTCREPGRTIHRGQFELNTKLRARRLCIYCRVTFIMTERCSNGPGGWPEVDHKRCAGREWERSNLKRRCGRLLSRESEIQKNPTTCDASQTQIYGREANRKDMPAREISYQGQQRGG